MSFIQEKKGAVAKLNWFHSWLKYCRSVAKSCPTLCDPWIAARQASVSFTNLEFAQAHFHWVSDAILSSRPSTEVYSVDV